MNDYGQDSADYTDGVATVHIADALTMLRNLPAESIQCCVTSPPYWGLRDYGLGDAGIGLEATLEEWVAKLVAVFAEVRRVLRLDGTLWLNVGDAYGSGTRASRDYSKTTKHGYWNNPGIDQRNPSPAKQLLMLPARLALALQADGWYLRSDIIWAKPNPMPESVTDRPTSSYEHVFLLTKSPRYFYDQEALREPGSDTSRLHGPMRLLEKVILGDQVWEAPQEGFTRNSRNVWTIATQPYPEAHFATFPEELARRCIVAGTSERGCCPECGAPWARETERGALLPERPNFDGRRGLLPKSSARGSFGGDGRDRAGSRSQATTTGWEPACKHTAEPVPCVVLDPFAGSGTTLAVAKRLNMDSIGIELNPDYLPLIVRRLEDEMAQMSLSLEPSHAH